MSTGSLDCIQDALDILDREQVVYVLVIGRPGEHVTRTWCDLRGNTDQPTKDHLVNSVCEAFKEIKEDDE